jgi:hypothetical protein
MRLRYLILPLFLAGCVQKLPQDAGGDYLTFTNIGKNGDVCEVITDGAGKPIAIRGSIFAKKSNGCVKVQTYTSNTIKHADILTVTGTGAEIGWKKSGKIKITINKYGQMRRVWVEEAK